MLKSLRKLKCLLVKSSEQIYVGNFKSNVMSRQSGDFSKVWKMCPNGDKMFEGQMFGKSGSNV